MKGLEVDTKAGIAIEPVTENKMSLSWEFISASCSLRLELVPGQKFILGRGISAY